MEVDEHAQLSDKEFDDLLAAKNWDELTSIAQVALRHLNVDAFMKKMSITDGAGRTHVHVVGTLAPTLHDRFRATDRDAADPVMRHVSKQGMPLEWNVDTMSASCPALPYTDLKHVGLIAGLSMAARGDQSFSRIDFYSRVANSFSRKRAKGELTLFGFYLNEAARALWLKQHPPVDVPELTGREQECLRWSADGKTSNEIASILGISPNTVYFHLKKAASKFNVYGTRHAISRAIELRLI